MNKVYKLKLLRDTQQLVVVSELATNAVSRSTTNEPTKAKNNLSATAGSLLVAALGLSAPLASATTDPQVVAGAAEITKQGLVTTIKNTPNTIINWHSFSIAKDEIVHFLQQSKNSAVLNRVLGTQASEILGSLSSNGKVFLINPNGILFGKSATVNVAELVASTLELKDEDFKANRYVFEQEKDLAIASIINQGLIKVQEDGTLALVGGKVLNNGVLEARNGSIYLLAGNSISISDLENPLISYKVSADNEAINLGAIVSKKVNLLGNKVAHGASSQVSYAEIFRAANTTKRDDLKAVVTATGEVELFAGSVAEQVQTNKQTAVQVAGNRNGVAVVNAEISTYNPTGKAGNIKVLGDYVALEQNAKLNATGYTGGYVNIGGDYQGKGTIKTAKVTYLDAGAEVNTSAQHQAGTIIVWGNKARFAGSLTAESAADNGGFIETSAHSFSLDDEIKISTLSQKGKEFTGTWLLDPDDLYIYNASASAPDMPEEAKSNDLGSSGATESNKHVFTATSGTSSSIKDSTITTKLSTTDVELKAAGNITVTTGSTITGEYHTLKLTTTNGGTETSGNIIVNSATINTQNLEFSAEGTIAIHGSTLGNLDAQAAKGFTIDTNSNIRAQRIATFEGSLEINDSTITADNSVISLYGPDRVTIRNTTIKDASSIDVCATQGSVLIDNSTLNSTSIEIEAEEEGKSNIIISGGSKLVATSRVDIEAEDEINITGEGTQVSSNEDLSLTSRHDSVKIQDKAAVTAGKKNPENSAENEEEASTSLGNIEVFAEEGNLEVNGASIYTEGDFQVTAEEIIFEEANVTFAVSHNTTLNAERLKTVNGTITILDHSDRNPVMLQADKSVSIVGTTIDVEAPIDLEIYDGNKDPDEDSTNVESDLKLVNATINAKGAVKVTAVKGGDYSGTTFNSGSLELEAKGGDLNLAGVKAETRVTELSEDEEEAEITQDLAISIKAENGSANLSNATLVSGGNKVDVKAQKDIALSGLEASGSAVSIVTETGSLAGDGAKLTTSGEEQDSLLLGAEKGNLELINSTIVSNKDAKFKVSDKFTLDNTSISVQDDFAIDAQRIKIVNGSELRSEKGKFEVTAKQVPGASEPTGTIELENIKLHAITYGNFTAPGGLFIRPQVSLSGLPESTIFNFNCKGRDPTCEVGKTALGPVEVYFGFDTEGEEHVKEVNIPVNSEFTHVPETPTPVALISIEPPPRPQLANNVATIRDGENSSTLLMFGGNDDETNATRDVTLTPRNLRVEGVGNDFRVEACSLENSGNPDFMLVDGNGVEHSLRDIPCAASGTNLNPSVETASTASNASND